MVLRSPVISFCLILLLIKGCLTVLQVPEVCDKKTYATEDDLFELKISYDKASWEKNSYNKNKTCLFKLFFGSRSGQRVNLLLNIESGYKSNCLFDIYIYPNSIENSQPIQKFDCTESGDFNIAWPTNSVLIAFHLRPDFLRKTVSSSFTPGFIYVGVESCQACGFNKYGYTKDDFNEYQIPYYEVSGKGQCGSVGCLENVLQGFKVSPYVDKFLYGFKSCSLSLNIKDNTQVCIKQIKDSLLVFSCSADLQPYISVYIDGTKYLQLECFDAQQWWCFPWNISGKTITFSWYLKYDRSGSNTRKLFIASPSANKVAKKCGLFSSPTTTEAFKSWTTWSSSDDFDSSSSEDGGKNIGAFVGAVTFIIGVIVFYVMYKVIKKLQKRHSDDIQMSPPECRESLTSPITRNPENNGSSYGHTETRWSAGQPSGSNDTVSTAYVSPRAPPETGSTYVTPSAPPAANLDTPQNGLEITDSLDPPSYDEVMKNSNKYLT